MIHPEYCPDCGILEKCIGSPVEILPFKNLCSDVYDIIEHKRSMAEIESPDNKIYVQRIMAATGRPARDMFFRILREKPTLQQLEYFAKTRDFVEELAGEAFEGLVLKYYPALEPPPYIRPHIMAAGEMHADKLLRSAELAIDFRDGALREADIWWLQHYLEGLGTSLEALEKFFSQP